MGKHQKHAKLKLRENDNFATNEIAIIGTKCDVISNLVQQVAHTLDKYKIAYFDASHNDAIESKTFEKFVFHHKGSAKFDVNLPVNKFNQRIQFSQYDFLFINGNHYEGTKQVLILDNDKEASVQKRLSQLNNIQFVIKLTNDSKYFDFLVAHNPQIKNLMCYSIDEIDKITNHFENLIKEKIASIQGLE